MIILNRFCYNTTFKASHPSWMQLMGSLGTASLAVVVAAVGGSWTAANSVMNGHLGILREDVAATKRDVEALKEDMRVMRQDLGGITSDMRKLTQELSRHRET